MARIDDAYNPATDDDGDLKAGDFPVLPAGLYAGEIQQSDFGPNKKGDGKVIRATFAVKEGEFAGRLVFLNFNIQNPSAQAVSIGRKQFTNLCKACGFEDGWPEDTAELHGVPIFAKVKVRPAKPPYAESNDVTAFMSYEDGQALDEPPPSKAQAKPPAAAAPAKKTAASSAPWKK